MPQNKTEGNWLIILAAVITLAGFFLPWVSWGGIMISGHDLPLGKFFSTSENKFGLANPFPQFDFAMKVFWLVPLFSLLAIFITIKNKPATWFAGFAGALALSQSVVYILFTNTLLQLGVGKSLLSSLNVGIYLTIAGSMVLILAGMRTKSFLKLTFIIAGPLMVWLSFSLISKYMEKEKYDDSAKLKSDYTVNAFDLINEFKNNDSLANSKYREKIVTVHGRVSETELPNDSTVNIKIADSTGSYVIFPLLENYLEEAKRLKPSDSVIIKGSCSGGIFSEILETETINFKRCALIKQ